MNITKRLTVLLLAALVLFTSCGEKKQFVPLETKKTEVTEEFEETEIITEKETEITTEEETEAMTEADIEVLKITKGCAFGCMNTGELFRIENADAYVSPASLTKLLTAAVAFHYADPQTVYTVGTEQSLVQPHSSLCLVNPGYKMKLYDLVAGMLLASGNDASYTIAVSVARTLNAEVKMSDKEAVKYFCDLMNDFAAEIGMNNSHFVNPDGWDDPKQYTTVYDLMYLARHVLTVPELCEITGTLKKSIKTETGEPLNWLNSNYLLNPNSQYYNEYAVGMKTGTTDIAGNCLLAVFKKNDKTYVSVVVGCDTDSERYVQTLEMFKEYT